MDEKIAQVDREVVAGILHAIDEGKPFVTYGDLAKDIEARTGRRVNAHVGFDRPLERIQGYCKACDAPNLSSFVVNQKGHPGKGFIACHRDMHPDDDRDDDRILEEEQRACVLFEDWSRLMEHCGMSRASLWRDDGESFDPKLLNWGNLAIMLDQYYDAMASELDGESYKWEAAAWFGNRWDLEAKDFPSMLSDALSKAGNLLTSRRYFAFGMLKILSEHDPEAVRASFRGLFDEAVPLTRRMANFEREMSVLLVSLNAARAEAGEEPAEHHYQDAHAMSVYLAFARCDRHYLYKADSFARFAARVGADIPNARAKYERVEAYERLCDELVRFVEARRPEVVERADALLGEALRNADPFHHLLIQDIVYFAGEGASGQWAYAPGEQAGRWEEFRSAGVMGIGWDELGDLSRFKTKRSLENALRGAYGVENPRNDANTIQAFVDRLKPGDIVWARKGLKLVIGKGIVRSGYRFEDDRGSYRSVRDVEWLDIEPFEVSGRFPQAALSELTEKTSVRIGEVNERAAGAELVQEDCEWWPSKGEYDPRISVERWQELFRDSSVFRDPESFVLLGCMRANGGVGAPAQLARAFGRSIQWYQNQAVSLAKRIAAVMPGVKPDLGGNNDWWPILFVGRHIVDEGARLYAWKLREELSCALDAVDWSRYRMIDADGPDVIEKSFWWLTASPKIWSFSNIEVGSEQSYTIHAKSGAPRRVPANFAAAKAGDLVIGYEAAPVKKAVALCEIVRNDGKNLYFKKVRDLLDPVPYAEVKGDDVLSGSQFVKNPNGSLFALTEEQYERVLELAGEDEPAAPAEAVERFTDERFLEQVYVSSEDLQTMKRLLKRKKNLILQGAPGTGKTFCARRLAWAIMGQADDSRIDVVQFHQSAAYDDMVAGYRPADGGGYEPVAGEFLRFCDKAARDPEGRPWFFIIDEINRANVSKVFGELLMLIEAGHRGESVRLPMLGRAVCVPSNLYLIGMMNTADRGLALIDYALRRRFVFFEMKPAFGNEGFEKALARTKNAKLCKLVQRVRKLNEELADDPSFGPGFRIGHSYFCFELEEPDVGVSDDEVSDVIEFELAPLLREYWFDDPDRAKSEIDLLRG